MSTETKPPAIMKFRVLQGLHIDTDPKNPGQDKIYAPGSIVSTPQDLVKRYNAPGSVKFERVDEYAVDANYNPLHRRPDETPEEYRTRMSELANAALEAATAEITTSSQEEGENESLSASPEQVLETMTVDELTKHAQEEEIDLQGATKKKDIIRIIKNAAVLVGG